jgi:hypothetical protein
MLTMHFSDQRIALHYARSTAARIVHFRTFVQVYAASRALWMTDWRPGLEAGGLGCFYLRVWQLSGLCTCLYVAVRGIGRAATCSHVHIADSVATPKPVQ